MKKIIIALSFIPVLVFSMTAKQKEAFNRVNIEKLQKQGLPTPGSAMQLVPRKNIKIPGWQMQKSFAANREMKNKGYINKSSERAYELMNIKVQIKKMQPQQAMMFKGTDSHLRQKAKDIPFAYTYIGVPKEEATEFYGIAPVGTYVKEAQSGWTGAVEFFKTSFAHCAYTENNMVAAHGAAQIAEEEVQYDVNGKITLIDIEGNPRTGFLYRINWFDNVFNRNLECAAKNFSQANRAATIELAKKIDAYYQS